MMTLKEVLKEMEAAKKPVVKKLQEGKEGHVLAIGMQSEVILKEHKSDIPAKIVVIKGQIAYNAEDEQIILDLFEEFDIPVGEYHWVQALKDSIFLVIKG